MLWELHTMAIAAWWMDKLFALPMSVAFLRSAGSGPVSVLYPET